MFRFYLGVAAATFRRQVIYRWANLAGLVTNIFFGVITSSVFVALYAARPQAGGYDLHAALRYLWAAQSLVMVTLPFADNDLALTIRTGEVVADLAKPCDFYWLWVARFAGRSAYYLLYRGVPCYLAGMLLFGIGLPADWQAWLGLALGLPLGAAVAYAYRFMYNVAAFWVLEPRAVTTMAGVVAQFFGGLFVPLPFFPPGLRALTGWLPFSGMMNAFTAAFAGKLTGPALALSLAQQLLWLVALTLLARLVLAGARRRVVVQGG